MAVPAIPAMVQYAVMAVAAIGSGVQAYSSYQAGKAQQAAYAGEARAKETEAHQAALQATQISALRAAELNANLSSIMAARAGKNLSGDSPTEQALTKSFTRESLTSKSSEVLDARMRRLGAINARDSATASGKAAYQAGVLGAISGTADMVARFGRMVPSSRPTSTRRIGGG